MFFVGNYISHLAGREPVLAILATLVLIGAAAQILADRMRMAATGPLLFAGVLFGEAWSRTRAAGSAQRRAARRRFTNGLRLWFPY